MSVQFAGKAAIKIDGDTLETDAGASLDLGGATRTTVVGSNGALGYAEMPKQAHLECDVFVKESTSLKRFADTTNATITFTADTGNTWVLPNAWLTEPPVFTQAGEGSKVRLVFEATKAQEIS